MLQQGGLVGRVVTSGADAVQAAADGADLVFLEVRDPFTHAIQQSEVLLGKKRLHMLKPTNTRCTCYSCLA